MSLDASRAVQGLAATPGRSKADSAWTELAAKLVWRAVDLCQDLGFLAIVPRLVAGRMYFSMCQDMPVGIAAGFDKNAALDTAAGVAFFLGDFICRKSLAETSNLCFYNVGKVPLYRLGFMELGFAEVGSISAEPAAGNEKPRCWRIPSDQAVINCMGLNNEGAACVAARLKTFSRADGSAPIGINIAKTHSPAIVGPAAVDDFVQSFTTLAPLADFVVINVSCPNTAEGKTFEEPSALADLLSAVARQKKEMKWEKAPPPVLVKLMATPDSEDGRACQRELLRVIEDANVVDGLVISNTIKNPEAQLSSSGRQAADAIGKGGVSGRVIHARSVAAIRSAFEATGRLANSP